MALASGSDRAKWNMMSEMMGCGKVQDAASDVQLECWNSTECSKNHSHAGKQTVLSYHMTIEDLEVSTQLMSWAWTLFHPRLQRGMINILFHPRLQREDEEQIWPENFSHENKSGKIQSFEFWNEGNNIPDRFLFSMRYGSRISWKWMHYDLCAKRGSSFSPTFEMCRTLFINFSDFDMCKTRFNIFHHLWTDFHNL